MSEKKPFLNESEKNLSQDHKDKLGMDVPEGYFASSKQSILDLVKEEKSKVSQHHKDKLGMDVPEGYFASSKQSILDLVKEEKSKVSQHHKDKLGMDIPDGYFTSSKQSILDLVKEEKKKVPVFYLRRSFQIAASIALLVSLLVWTQFPTSTDIEIASNDPLIESLFVEDDSMNDFVEELLVEEVLEEAGKEKEMETILTNSLFVEDSLIDTYTEKSLLDNIIL